LETIIFKEAVMREAREAINLAKANGKEWIEECLEFEQEHGNFIVCLILKTALLEIEEEQHD
jgi:predicted RNase H-like HicB family nuclease